MERDDGGAAFPQHPEQDDVAGFGGMTLRVYLATHAPASEIDSMIPESVEGAAKFLGIPAGDYKGAEHYPKALAKARYIWADAMLDGRK